MERYESDYSEEFEEEELSSAALPSSKPSAWSLSVQPRRKARVGGGRRPGESEYGTPNRQQVVSKSRSTGAGRRARRIEPQSSRRSFQPRRLQQAKMAVAGSSPARDRQLSAMNHTLRGLQNRLSERERRLEEVCTENKLLSRLQKKQERDWGRLQRQEGELPQILRRHDQEVRALRQQLRRSHEEVQSGQEKLGELQDQLRRLSEANHRLEKVVGKRRLREREQLTVQLEQLTRQLADRENRVSELERGLEASGKTHSQEVKGLRTRNKALAIEAVSLRDTVEKLQSMLKEKAREMEVMNIYSQRIPRTVAKPHPPTPPPPPIVSHQSSQTTLSCPPFKSVSLHHRSQLRAASSQTEASSVVKSDSYTQTRGDDTPADNTVSMATTPHTERGGVVEGQRSKQDLLQRLRDLDGQKTAPASNPLSPPSVPTTTVNPFSTPSVPTTTINPFPTPSPSSKRPASKPQNPPPPAVTESKPAASTLAAEQERKRLLLAKLMAIDEGGNPNNIKTVVQQRPVGGASSNEVSRTSLTSWPEVVENMHQGRPAHSSEDDPFGSRVRLSGRGRGGGVRGGRVGEQKVFLTEQSGLSGREKVEEGEKESYKPSFGRRAAHTDHTHQDQPHPPASEKSYEPVSEATTPISRGGLLPRRPKADSAAVMRSDDVMPGAVISEPDDLEELVL